jgi:hypothetical protein
MKNNRSLIIGVLQGTRMSMGGMMDHNGMKDMMGGQLPPSIDPGAS